MNDAAGVATGVRREFDTVMRTQAEAVKEMARLAREENEALRARIAALEASLGSGRGSASAVMVPSITWQLVPSGTFPTVAVHLR